MSTSSRSSAGPIRRLSLLFHQLRDFALAQLRASKARRRRARNIEHFVVVEDFVATQEGQISLAKGQIVELVEQCAESPDWILVALESEDGKETTQGLAPLKVLTSVAESDATDRPSIGEPVSPGASGVVKRKSIRRFFNHSNGANSSAAQSGRPSSSVSLSVNHSAQPSSSAAHNRLSAAEPLQPEPSTSSSPNQESRPSPTCVLSTFPSDSGTLLQEPAPSPPDPNPSAVELPPPMSQLSSVVVDAASHLASPLMDEAVEQNGGESAAPERTPEETNRLKRQYVLQELVETERDYVRDLASVVDGYMAHLSTIELPEDLQGKDKIIFANVAQILEFHKSTFCREIERCLNDYEAAGQAFVKYERRLHVLYVKYCQNKPKSDYLVSQEHFEQFFAEAKQKIGHKLALCDLLIKPVQRIMKYQLLLKDICKFTQRAGDRTDVLERALQVMHVVPKACDDMMQVGRLQNFDGNLNAQGKLIFQWPVSIQSYVVAYIAYRDDPDLGQRAEPTLQGQRPAHLPLRAVGHHRRLHPTQEGVRQPHVHLQEPDHGEQDELGGDGARRAAPLPAQEQRPVAAELLLVPSRQRGGEAAVDQRHQ
uniref:Rho guanine nucleotide exchange factor 25 n=1 Tax=Steinernema glaseri TaxID=37863 RepID=A0A1I7YYE4_9BILA